jgi:hypothetical protein
MLVRLQLHAVVVPVFWRTLRLFGWQALLAGGAPLPQESESASPLAQFAGARRAVAALLAALAKEWWDAAPSPPACLPALPLLSSRVRTRYCTYPRALFHPASSSSSSPLPSVSRDFVRGARALLLFVRNPSLSNNVFVSHARSQLWVAHSTIF